MAITRSNGAARSVCNLPHSNNEGVANGADHSVLEHSLSRNRGGANGVVHPVSDLSRNRNFIRAYLFTPEVDWGPWVLVGRILKSNFRWIQSHHQIRPELRNIVRMIFGHPDLGWVLCISSSPLGAHVKLGFPLQHPLGCSPPYIN